MSRSYKKTPINKYGTCVTKAEANRKIRRGADMELPARKRKAYRLVTNPWEVNDVVSYWSKEQAIDDYYRNYSKYSWFREEFPTLEDYLQYWERCCKRK